MANVSLLYANESGATKFSGEMGTLLTCNRNLFRNLEQRIWLLRPREFLHLSPQVSKILTDPLFRDPIVISLLPQKTNLINYFLHFQLSFKSLSAQISIHPQAAALAIQLEKIENGALFPIENRRRIGGIAGQGQIGKGIERNSNV